MAYTRIDWKNGEAGNTPLNANNLNRMDEAIAELDERAGDSEYNFDSLEARVTQAETNLNGKMNKNNPAGSGILTIDAVNTQALTSMDVDTNDLEVSRISGKNGVIIATDDITVDGIPTPIGSLANTANTRAQEAETRANSAYNKATSAEGDAAIALEKIKSGTNELNKVKGLIGEGVGLTAAVKSTIEGKFLNGQGAVADYGSSAALIEVEVNSDNLVINRADLLTILNKTSCAFYSEGGDLLEIPEDIEIISEIDESGRITSEYIANSTVTVPAGAKYFRISSITNGEADIYTQNNISDAVKELQARPNSGLVLTSASPLLNSSDANVIGIDAKGKSWQSANAYDGSYTLGKTVQGYSSANRSVSNLIPIGQGVHKVKANNLPPNVWYGIFEFPANAYANGKELVSSVTDKNERTFTIESGYPYFCVYFGTVDNSAMTDSMFNSVSIYVEGTPTPTNPIPIIDASGEVVAIGKNLLDVSQITDKRIILDNGSINTNDSACASDFIKLESGQYTFTSKKVSNDGTVYIRVHAYDASKNWMRMIFKSANTYTASGEYVATFTMPTDAKYIRICWYRDNADSQLEIGTTATAYTEYQSNTITLPFELKSVENITDELIINEKGRNIIRYVSEKVFNGSENWTTRTAAGGWKLYELENALPGASSAHPANSAFVMSNQYSPSVYLDVDNTIRALNGGKITLRDDTVADLATFKSRMESNNLVVYYDLANPIETELTPEEVEAIRALRTYKGTTVIESELQIDSVTYTGDIKGYVDGLNTFSTAPTICGYDEDGTPRYRVKINTTTPSTAGSDVNIVQLPSNIKVKKIEGMVFSSGNTDIPINFFYSTSYYSAAWIKDNFIRCRVGSLYANMPCEIIIEYKLIDAAPAMVMSLEEETEG